MLKPTSVSKESLGGYSDTLLELRQGDFNEWSNIDVLVIAKQLPENPIERLSLVQDCMARVAGVEPLLLTPDMMQKMRGKNLAVREALEKGVVLVDDLEALKIP